MTVYGLTGKTGAGKSTVARYLKEKGFYVIDGDVIARQITDKGKPALRELCIFFGEDILLPDGSLNRRELAKRAFANRESTEKLNAITHPKIYDECLEEIKRAQSLGFENAVIDAAALLESTCKGLCQRIIVVTSPAEIRLQRILERDDITVQEAERRMSAQREDEYYFSQADIIIRNYPPYDLYGQLEELTG